MEPRRRNRSPGVEHAGPYAVGERGRAPRGAGAVSRGVALLRTGNPPAFAWLIPLGIAVLYLVVFVVKLPHNLKEILWIGDYSTPFTMIETIARDGAGAHTMFGTSGQFVPTWYGLLTAYLPLHRELWEITPTLTFLAMALLVGWCVAQLSDRRAGVLAALLVFVASPKALVFVMAAVVHNLAYLCIALVGAYLIWLTRADGRRAAVTHAVPPLVGVALGTALASEVLIGAAAIAPMLAAVLLSALRRRRLARSVARSVLITTGVAVAVALLTLSTMESLGLHAQRSPLKIADVSDLSVHTRLLFEGLNALFNGYLDHNSPGTLHLQVGVACEIVMCAALLAVLVVGLHALFRALWPQAPEEDSQTPAQLARSLHISYWFISAVGVCAAFWLTAETGTTVAHESYYASVLLSTAAIIPLLLSRGVIVRWLILAGAAIFFAGSFAGVTSEYVNMEVGLRAASYYPEILRIAKANNVSVGYGGYWEASSYTWITDGRLTVRPLSECNSPEGVTLCPFLLGRVTSWYVPHERHTFLLVDPAEGWINTAPPSFGRPLATYSFGTAQMLIYPYDIVSRVGPFPN